MKLEKHGIEILLSRAPSASSGECLIVTALLTSLAARSKAGGRSQNQNRKRLHCTANILISDMAGELGRCSASGRAVTSELGP